MGREQSSMSVRRMGTWLLLASLGVLFAASLVGYLVVRLRVSDEAVAAAGGLPGGLWISSASLVALSALLVVAERTFRRRGPRAAVNALAAALLLGIGFLALQTWNWMQMAASNLLPEHSILIWGFYTLTFLHAMHVIGGIVPLTLTTVRAYGGRYSAHEHETVHLVGLYWHFLLVTWVVIFVVLSL